ncbi:hypothetical protein [Streptomyces sp. NPDC048338]|uniref:hypothetical protein n=1 Tax=Streptomyces sp. NPDC048338 TaxID=3365536 RepID=UPI00371A896D
MPARGAAAVPEGRSTGRTRHAAPGQSVRDVGGPPRGRHDLLPQLLRLAASELRHGADGTVDRLDRRAEHALAAALAAVSLEASVATMGE